MILSLIGAAIFILLFQLLLYEDDILISFGFSEVSTFISLLLVIKIFTVFSFILNIPIIWLSRKFVYEADTFTKENGFRDELCAALVRLHVKNASNLNPDSLYSRLNFTDPTLIERLQALGYVPNNENDGKSICNKSLEDKPLLKKD